MTCLLENLKFPADIYKNFLSVSFINDKEVPPLPINFGAIILHSQVE